WSTHPREAGNRARWSASSRRQTGSGRDGRGARPGQRWKTARRAASGGIVNPTGRSGREPALERERAPSGVNAEACEDDAADSGPRRPIRSFVLRQGRLSPAQERACRELMPVYGIDYAPRVLDLGATFGRHAPVVLEIG